MANKSVYDTSALYNHKMDDKSQNTFIDFYKKLFSGYIIERIHDCSIGAGGPTLPLAKLGYTVSGSDLSENLLNRAKINFAENGFFPNLFISDFREFGAKLAESVDCIMSTGSSLPHADLEGFKDFIFSASQKLNRNGLLFFDIRNWDALLREKPVFIAYDPHIMTADEHETLYLLFDWHDDGSVTFSVVTSIDKNGKHESHNIDVCPTIYPLLRKDILNCLNENGYKLIKYVDMDEIWMSRNLRYEKCGDFDKDFDNIQWYGVLAQKIV